MLSPRTYEVRFGCDNCGHIALYDMPVRFKIVDYHPHGDDEFEDHPVYSSIERPSGKDHQIIVCKFCQLPHLKVLYWQDDVDLVNAEK